ncbi:MAG: cytochrome c3 family protein [Sphingomonas sp.]|nr:cytochrome c3 family protein [Sphingomonas sp.]
MIFRLRQITRTAAGRDITRERMLEQPSLSVGRAAERDLQLPDLAVAPDHATIERIDERRIRVRASGTLGFDSDGRPTRDATIDAWVGGELRFGGHRITVSREDDDIVLLVERVEPLSEAERDVDETAAYSLRRLLPGKRTTAWLLVVLVLGLFIGVPIWWHGAAQGAPDQRNIYALRAQQSWSSGPLSDAHHALEGKCESCHVKAFVSVRDDTCRTCHKQVHDHAPLARQALARASPGAGDRFLRDVAHFFGKEGAGACVDCHTEHEGAGAMPPTRQAFCSDCHADLKRQLADTKLGNAGDFGKVHPQFSPVVMTAPGEKPVLQRVSLDAGPKENSGLKFPHKLHLSGSGGVARMAQRLGAQNGFGSALACKDCHTPSADGTRFLPVSMERNCAACHSLGFEQIGGTVRTLRHGAPEQVIADLRAFYRSTPATRPIDLGGMVRRRPGDNAQGQVARVYNAAAISRPASAEAAIRAVFSKGGACYDCHVIAPPSASGKGWDVVPVHQSLRYMFHGWFDHAAHRTEKCESCHAAPQSTEAADLLVPGIKTCRTCHGGEASSAKVPSSCAMCHRYHLTPGAPWRSEREAVWRGPVTATRPRGGALR